MVKQTGQTDRAGWSHKLTKQVKQTGQNGAAQVGRLPIFHAMDLDGRARLASVLRPCFFHAGGEVACRPA